MADITLPQTIPSALRDEYKKVLGVARDGNRVFKRYPFRVPSMQTKDGNPSPEQKKQRLRFIEATKSFASTDDDTRERWFDAMPEYHSLLWYYNYFVLSALNGVLGAIVQGAQVIKNIINLSGTVGTAGTTFTMGEAVDPSKCVVMLWGAAYSYSEAQVGDYPYAWAWPVYPVWSNLNSSNIVVDWALPPQEESVVAVQVIEYI